MANDIASQATWQINCSARAGGNKRIRRMKDWAIADDASKEAVPEVGSVNPVGFKRTPGAKKITFNMRQRKGAKPEIDWWYLSASDEVISLTKQIVGGRRVQYPECEVSQVTENGDDQGEIMFTVEVIALREEVM
jgi:hypothetical protein